MRAVTGLQKGIAGLLAVGMLGGLFFILFMGGGSPSVTSTPKSTAPMEVINTEGETSGFDGLYLLPTGSIAPQIQATSANGKTIKMESLQKKGEGSVLIFYQGVFCSVCANQLEGFQAHITDFKKKGYNLLAISADTLPDAQERQGKSGLSFPVIPDPERAIISNYGVANVTRGNIAYPTVYVIDAKGKVAFSFADEEMTRLQATDLLKKLEAI
jgi:peroxiredoxin Q/BCP